MQHGGALAEQQVASGHGGVAAGIVGQEGAVLRKTIRWALAAGAAIAGGTLLLLLLA